MKFATNGPFYAHVVLFSIVFGGVCFRTAGLFGQQAAKSNTRPPTRSPALATPAQQNRTPAPPFQLTPAQQDRVDQILNHWERKTGQIQRFTCSFHRFEYQPQWLKNAARTISDGTIRFQAPDRGEFQITKYREYTGQDPNGKPRYDETESEHLEHWLCDGTTIFEFDPRQKLLIERNLPPEWRGKAITNGPLPFLFGAKAKQLKERYWVREVRAARTDEIQLEIVPKTSKDAVNYNKVHIMLAAGGQQADFLPNGMILFLPGGEKKTFQFKNRQINKRSVAGVWRIFNGDPFRAKTPPGWQRLVDNGPNAGGTGGHGRVVEQPRSKKRRLLPR